MNQRLTDKLAAFPDAIAAAETNEAIQSLVVDLEAAVLKSNLEEFQSGNARDYEAVVRDYVVGEPNTRGLSWKLNLLRLVATANFCSLLRVGVHGGNTRVLGQDENLDTTFTIYNGLVPAYEALSKKAFQDFSDKQDKDAEGGVHRVGWVNKYLIDAPTDVFNAVEEARVSSGNSKITAMIETKDEQLKALKETLIPAKAEPAPKAEKAPKSKKASKKSDAEIIAEQNAEAEVTEINSESEALSDTPDIAE